MLFTFFCAIAGAAFKKEIGAYEHKPMVNVLSLLGSIGFCFWLVFSEKTRKSVPLNYIVLGAFTLCEGLLFCGLTARLEMEIQAVIEAILALAIICGSLFITVWNCKDFVGFHRVVI